MESAATIGSGIEIRASTIPGGGNGLFTSRLFHKNELITEYFGPIIDHEKAKKLRKQNKHSHVRVLTIQFQYIDGIKQPRPGVGGASFANDARDSQKNNAVFVCRHDHKLGRDRVYLKATRELPPGTEVFVGYGRDYWRNSKKPPASPPKQQPAKQLRCDSEQEAESPQREQHQHMRTRSGGRKHPQQQQQQQQRVQEQQQEQETQAEPPLQPPARLVQEALVQADRKQAAAAAGAGGAAVAAAQRHVLPIPKQQPAAGHIPVHSSSRVKQKYQQQEQEQQQAAAAVVAIVQQQQQEERQQQEQDSDKESLLQAPAQLVQELPVQAVSRQAAAADAAAAIAQLQLLATQQQQQQQQQQPAAGHMKICSPPTIQRSPQQKQQQAAAAAAVVQQPEQQAAVAAAPVVQKQKQQAAVAATAVVQQQQAQLARSTMQPDPVRTAAAAQAAALQLHGQLAPPPPQQQQHVGHSDTQLDPAAAAAAAAPVAAVQAALLQLHQQQAQQPAQLVLPMQPGAGHGPVFVPLGGNLALAGFVPLCSTPLLAGAVPFDYVIAPQQLNPFVQHAASRTNPRFMLMGVNVPRRQRSMRASRTSSVVPAAAAALLQSWHVAAALAAPGLHQQQQQRKEPRQGSFDSSEAENSTAVDPDWVQGQREGEETAAAAGQELCGSGDNPSMQLAARHADSGFWGVQIPRRQRSTRAGRAGSGVYASSGGTQRPLKRSCVSVYRDKRRSVKRRLVAAKRPCVAAEQVPEADPFGGNHYRRVYTHTRCKAAVHDGTDEDSSEEDCTSSSEEDDVGEADTPTAVGAAAAPAAAAAAAAAALPAAVAAASGDVEGVSRSAGRRPFQKRSRAPKTMNAAAAEDCPLEVQQLLDEGNPYKRVYRRNWADLQDADAGGDADWEPDGDADEDATDWEPGSQCHVAGGNVVSSSGNGLSQKRSYVSNHKAKAAGVVEECALKVQQQPDEVNPYKKVYRRSWGGAQDGDAGMPTGGRGCGTPAGRRRRVASGGGVDSSGGRWQLQARSCASVYRAE